MDKCVPNYNSIIVEEMREMFILPLYYTVHLYSIDLSMNFKREIASQFL